MSPTQTHAPPKPKPIGKDVILAAIQDTAVESQLIAGAVAGLKGNRSIDPKDLVQETFHRALKNAETFDPEQNVPVAWMQGILKNILCEQFRKQIRFPKTGIELATHADSSAAKEWHEDLADMRFRYERYIGQVRSEYVAALKLRHLEGLEYDEVAKRLGTTAVNARKLVSRGYAAIEALAEADKKGGRS